MIIIKKLIYKSFVKIRLVLVIVSIIMKIFIIILFSFVASVTVIPEIFGVSFVKRYIHFTEVAFDFCDNWTYYFTHNSTQFCLTTQSGLFIMMIGGLIYFLMCISIVPMLLWMLLKSNEI